MELPKTDTELARFLFDALKAMADGSDIAFFCTEEEEKRRYDICKACPFFTVEDVFDDSSDEQDEYCKGCGCPISAKVANPLDRCPGNFWTEHFESFRLTGYYEITRAIRKD